MKRSLSRRVREIGGTASRRSGGNISAGTGEVATAVYPPEDFGYDADNPDELDGYTASFYFAPRCRGLDGAH